MSQTVELKLPGEIVRRAGEIADHTRRHLEDVLVEWLCHAAEDPPIQSLPDDQLLALADLQMDADLQAELSELLALNREGQLSDAKRARLDELMAHYRRDMVRKAQALQTAVERGLRSPLGES